MFAGQFLAARHLASDISQELNATAGTGALGARLGAKIKLLFQLTGARAGDASGGAEPPSPRSLHSLGSPTRGIRVGGRRRADGTSRTLRGKARRVTVRQIKLMMKRMGRAVVAHLNSGRGNLAMCNFAVDQTGVAHKTAAEPQELQEFLSTTTLAALVAMLGPDCTLEQAMIAVMQRALNYRITEDVPGRLQAAGYARRVGLGADTDSGDC